MEVDTAAGKTLVDIVVDTVVDTVADRAEDRVVGLGEEDNLP